MRRQRVLARASTLTLAALLLAVCAGAGTAATISPDAGTMDASIITPISTFFVSTFDVRGTMSFLVSDPAPIGSTLATDMFDLVTPAPFPNSALRALNSGFDQDVILVFDAGGLEISGTSLTVPATGIPIGAVSDPALSAFVGPLVFGFTFDALGSFFDIEADVALLNFDLVSVSRVPAPGSALLLALGALATALTARRRRHR